MKKLYFTGILIGFLNISMAQLVAMRLQQAFSKLQRDPQLKHAIFSLAVVDAKSGQSIFSKNAGLGLAPASCQKIFTSVAAFELLGASYRYTTKLGYDGRIDSGLLMGNLFLIGSGDPSLGSWRWEETHQDHVVDQFIASIKSAGIRKIAGTMYIDDSKFDFQPVPGGWIWEDIGNYYGAGSWGINWNENQYDLVLHAGKNVNDLVTILEWKPPFEPGVMVNQIRTGEKGSGDNSYIYLPPYGDCAFANGTIPSGSDRFIISGSIPDPPKQFGLVMQKAFSVNHIELQNGFRTARDKWSDRKGWPAVTKELITVFSPPLDSLNYWFLKKSINLYGEVFVKTLAMEKTGTGSTDKGIELLKAFWVAHGIESSAIQIRDGSGLAPQNRVTTDALVKALMYARTRPWFPSFFNSLPEINAMKMKSGSIGGSRSYAGYHKASNKKEYIFAIIINNYDGDPATLVRKMYRVLDLLK